MWLISVLPWVSKGAEHLGTHIHISFRLVFFYTCSHEMMDGARGWSLQKLCTVVVCPTPHKMETTVFSCRKRKLWNKEHWQLVPDRPCSCNFGCHHAWVSLSSRKSGFVLKCKPKQLKEHHQSWAGRVELEAAALWVTTVKFIRKYHSLPLTKKYWVPKPSYRKWLSREKSCICTSPFLTASPWKPPWKSPLSLSFEFSIWLCHISYKQNCKMNNKKLSLGHLS